MLDIILVFRLHSNLLARTSIVSSRLVCALAGIEHVNAQTIRKIRSHLRTHGHHTAPRISKLGRPTRLTAPIQDGLAAYLDARPWTYLDEMEYHLFDDRGIVVNKSTISRASKPCILARRF